MTEEDVLKIVDFGVSEMFDKEGEMKTAKSAGSPAFMPPELCVAKHGHVSGRAADIWSMGCTLYCLLFGRIPFERTGMIELYQSIRNDPLEFDMDCNDDLKDLLNRLLEKDPSKRITMEQIRVSGKHITPPNYKLISLVQEHPWVTRQGTDPLLAKSENVAVIIDPPTDEEVNAAITGNMGHLVTVVTYSSPALSPFLTDLFKVRAVKRFKQLLFRRRPERIESILGSASRIVQPPLSMRPSVMRKSKSQDTHDRRSVESTLSTEGVHHDIKIDDKGRKIPYSINDMAFTRSGLRAEAVGNRPSSRVPIHNSSNSQNSQGLNGAKTSHENISLRPSPSPANTTTGNITTSGPTTPIGKGHAHNPLEDTLFLNIGTGEDCVGVDEEAHIVSESPSNVDIDVYEAAYEEEVQRIIAQRKDQYANRHPTLYLTRRVENVKSIRDNDCIFDEGQDLRQNLKGSFKTFVTKNKEAIEARGEMQKIQDGKEGKLSRTMRNVREAKRLVEEARERVKTEERDRERERSRSATPVLRTNSSTSGLSRSGTPVGG